MPRSERRIARTPCECCGDGCDCGCVTVCPRHADLRTPEEWGEVFNVQVLDPDGWRGEDDPDWSEPISREEYQRRMVVSTVQPLTPNALADAFQQPGASDE